MLTACVNTKRIYTRYILRFCSHDLDAMWAMIFIKVPVIKPIDVVFTHHYCWEVKKDHMNKRLKLLIFQGR